MTTHIISAVKILLDANVSRSTTTIEALEKSISNDSNNSEAINTIEVDLESILLGQVKDEHCASLV